MAKKKEEEVMCPYPYPMMYPPNMAGGEDQLSTYIRMRDFFDKMAKEAKDKSDADKKKKPEARKYSFFEMWGFAVFAGPVVGLTYLYGIKLALQQIELWFK